MLYYNIYNMTHGNYHPYGLNLSEKQINSIRRSKAKRVPISIRLKNGDLDGSTQLMLTKTQINQINKAKSKGTGIVIALSESQIGYQSGEGIKEVGQKIKNFFENDVKNFFRDDVPNAMNALGKNGVPGLVGYAGSRIAEVAKNRANRRQQGGAIDPSLLMAGVTGAMEGVGELGKTIGKYSNEQAKRGFAKNIITKKYARKAAKNLRAMQKRAVKHYNRLIKLQDKGKVNPNLTEDDLWNMSVSTFAKSPEESATLQQMMNDQYANDDEIDDDGDYVPDEEDDDTAEEVYGGIIGGGLFIHGRGFNGLKNYKRGGCCKCQKNL